VRLLDDRRRLAVCAALSGGAGLIYEILWSRRLTEVFGHTTLAVATVAAAFMAGQAVGSTVSDGLARRYPGRGLRLYAVAELGVALFGWFSFGWLGLVERWASSGAHPVVLASAGAGAWFGVFLAALGPPTFLMGMALPLLVARAEGGDDAAAFGSLYGWNTLGGALGCFLAGVILPPWFGLALTLRTAAAMSAAAGLLAGFGVAGRADASPVSRNRLTPLFVVLAFVSGAVAMTCEVAWLRLLQLLLGSSTQTISLVLLVVLLGLGAGGLLYRFARTKLAPDERGWIWLQLGLAAWLLAGLFIFERSFYLAASVLADPASSFAFRLLAQAIFAGAFIFPGCLLMGLALPWLYGCARGESAGSDVGIFYGANASGCIVGSALAAFWLLPAFGMELTLRGAALLCVLLAGAVALRAGRGPALARKSPWAAAALGAAALALPRALDPALLSSGVYLYGPNFSSARSFKEFRRLAEASHLLYYADGLSTTVTVKEDSGGRHLQVNGKTDASTQSDRLTQLTIGYVPLLLNPLSGRVLVIGLGTGMTASTLAQSRLVHSISVVELEPRMAEAAEFFDADNGGLLRDPRLSLIFQDARLFLRANRDQYDIIAAEPSNPWVSGVASLYTRENLLNASRRLAPRGVYCQWLQAYRMSEKDFRSALATFASVFPHVFLYRAGTTTDYLMIGSNDGWTSGGSAYANALVDMSPALREGLARLQLDDPSQSVKPPRPRVDAHGHEAASEEGPRTRIAAPFKLLAGEFVLGDRAFRRYAAGAEINTDDRPSLEFSAPRYLFASEEQRIYLSLEAAREEELPAEFFPDKKTLDAKTVQTVLGKACLALDDFPRGLRLLRAAVERDPGDPRLSTDYARALIRIGRPDEAETLLLAVIARNPRFASAYFHLADLQSLRGDPKKALSWAERGLRLEPDDARANLSVGSLYLGVGKKDAAKRAFERALKGKLDEPTRRALQANLALWR
jgi:spermidine synthase/Flp pilus assembly protein TadD